MAHFPVRTGRLLFPRVSQSCGALSTLERPDPLLPNDRGLLWDLVTGLSGLSLAERDRATWHFCGLHSGDFGELHSPEGLKREWKKKEGGLKNGTGTTG